MQYIQWVQKRCIQPESGTTSGWDLDQEARGRPGCTTQIFLLSEDRNLRHSDASRTPTHRGKGKRRQGLMASC